jgi:hypothetical protein
MSKLTDKEYGAFYAMGFESRQQVDDFLKGNPTTQGGEETVYVKMPTESMHSPTDKPTAGNPAVPVSRATRQALDYYPRLRANYLAL